ncbi:MAG: hypothetical protein R6U13_16115, partial [Desulfatiglandaceae bacterium]
QSNTTKLEAWSAFNIEANHFTTENYISGLGQYRSIDSRSALHLCNALSSECLRTDTPRMYPYLIPASAIVLLTQTVFILRFG